jgi:5'-3' exoribonuclease 1
MNILIGNDFVPHLPHVHIVKGAVPKLYQIYSKVLPTLDGYINENGILNLTRFEAFIVKLSQFDIETFREGYDDMKFMESKTGKNIVLGEKMVRTFFKYVIQ